MAGQLLTKEPINARFTIVVNRATLDTDMQATGTNQQTAHAACVFLLRACIEKLDLDRDEFLAGVMADLHKAELE